MPKRRVVKTPSGAYIKGELDNSWMRIDIIENTHLKMTTQEWPTITVDEMRRFAKEILTLCDLADNRRNKNVQKSTT